MIEVKFKKPYYRWLFGGVGFHNSEASMTKLMTESFKNEKVLKVYRELSPTFSRIFAGFHNWTKEAMDEFADYYHETFEKSNCSLYLVPGRMPLHETKEEREVYVENVAKNLAYLVHEKGLKLIRYYCVTNELSVGNTYAYLSNHLDLLKEYHTMLWRAFKKYDITDIGLMATDVSGVQNFGQIDWAIDNMDEVTAMYCGHNYEVLGYKYDDEKFYNKLYDVYDEVVQKAKEKEKRFILGEFGIHDGDQFEEKRMRNDVFTGLGDKKREAEYALMACVEILACMNAGGYGAVYWTMCDYPDPFINDWGTTEEDKIRYEVAKFSGHGTSIRYNKNGMFTWEEEGKVAESRPFLYTVGLLSKFFRKGSRVLDFDCEDKKLICTGVTNSDLSTSLCIINLSNQEKELSVSNEHKIDKPYRLYRYECDNVPYNKFLDLQGFEKVDMLEGDICNIKVGPHSLTVLTTDYIDRKPMSVTNIRVKDNRLMWDKSNDEFLCYYRVFAANDKNFEPTTENQIASTVAEFIELKPEDQNKFYKVLTVDKFGNVN